MAQHSFQVGKKVKIFRGNKHHATCDMRGTVNTNTKTNYYTTPGVFDMIEENNKIPGDEGYHVNYGRDMLLVISTTGSEYGG